MKEKILFVIDQVLFSVINFIVFLTLDHRFFVEDVAQYSVMISASAFLLNFGFAVKVEKLLYTSERQFGISDLLVLFFWVLVAGFVIYFFLWSDCKSGILLALVMVTNSLLWVLKRICVLDSKRIKFSIGVTLYFGIGVMLGASLLSNYSDVLRFFLAVNISACVYLSLLVMTKNLKTFRESFLEVFSLPLVLIKSLVLVPLLWFPSNGVYIFLASIGAPLAIVEVRKVLMLLSPIQQISGALISFLFSKGHSYKLSYIEVLLLPFMIAIVAAPVAAVLYERFLNGQPEGVLMWVSFAMIVLAMIMISLLQSRLRVFGRQMTVVNSLIVAVVIKISLLYYFYSQSNGGIGISDSLFSMAVAYVFSAIYLFVDFVKNKRILRLGS